MNSFYSILNKPLSLNATNTAPRVQLSAGTVGGAPPSLMRQVTSVDGGAEDGSKPEGLGGGGDDDGAGDGGQIDMGLMMATIASLNTSSSSSGGGGGGGGDGDDGVNAVNMGSGGGLGSLFGPTPMMSKKDKLNLSGLLNVLDGVVDTPERILIMSE